MKRKREEDVHADASTKKSKLHNDCNNEALRPETNHNKNSAIHEPSTNKKKGAKQLSRSDRRRQSLIENHKGESNAWLYRTIQCGIRKLIKNAKTENNGLCDLFEEVAIQVGTLRYLTGIIANQIVIEHFDESKNNMEELFENNNNGVRVFFERVFNAIRQINKQSKPKNEIERRVHKIMSSSEYDGVKLHLRNWQDGNGLIYTMMTQPIHVELATATKRHVAQFDDRLYHHFHKQALHEFDRCNIEYCKRSCALLKHIATNAKNSCLFHETNFKRAFEQLETALNELRIHALTPEEFELARDKFVSFVEAERQTLNNHHLLDELNTKTKKSNTRTYSLVETLIKHSERPETVRLLLYHTIRYSLSQEQHCDRTFERKTHNYKESSDPDISNEMDEHDPVFIDEWDGETERKKYVKKVNRKKNHLCVDATYCERPRPFNVLPLPKHRPAMVKYDHTVLKTLIAFAQKQKNSLFEELEKEDLVKEFYDTFFNARYIKGNNPRTCEISHFVTDGVRISLVFYRVGSRDNTSALLDRKGVEIPVPTHPVDITTQKRGLYRLTESRNDIAVLSETEYEHTKMVVVDPGKVKPIEMAKCVVGATNDWMPSMTKEESSPISHWSVTKDDYKRKTGRTELERVECEIRKQNSVYSNAIQEVRLERRRTASLNVFGCYIQTVLKHFDALQCERIKTSRSMLRWKTMRKRMHAFSVWSDHLFERASCTRKKQYDEETKRIVRKKLSDSAAKEKHKTQCDGVCTKRRIVSFGDGRFSSCMRGSCPIAKKEFLKYLAVRGVTLYAQEDKTSQMCPCGTSELINVNPDSRFRCHKTLSTANQDHGRVCPLSHVATRGLDRDELATLNMLHILQNALKGEAWPRHLIKTKRHM